MHAGRVEYKLFAKPEVLFLMPKSFITFKPTVIPFLISILFKVTIMLRDNVTVVIQLLEYDIEALIDLLIPTQMIIYILTTIITVYAKVGIKGYTVYLLIHNAAKPLTLIPTIPVNYLRFVDITIVPPIHHFAFFLAIVTTAVLLTVILVFVFYPNLTLWTVDSTLVLFVALHDLNIPFRT